MNSNLIPIVDTFYKEYFENDDSNEVYLLEKDVANNAWIEAIDPFAQSYFSLPDENWIITNTSTVLGDWRSAYNADDRESISNILSTSVDWPEDTVIRFLLNKDTILHTTWRTFKSYWDNFLAIEDDCPLVIPQDKNIKQAILFTPRGVISRIG